MKEDPDKKTLELYKDIIFVMCEDPHEKPNMFHCMLKDREDKWIHPKRQVHFFTTHAPKYTTKDNEGTMIGFDKPRVCELFESPSSGFVLECKEDKEVI